MAKRPEDAQKPSRAARLLGAIEQVRVDRSGSPVEMLPVPLRPDAAPAADSRKTSLRAITFPKTTNALRQHVTAVKAQPIQPTTRIRQRPVPAAPAVSDRTTGPSPRLRLRAAEAGRATEHRLAVARGAAEAALELGAIGPVIGSPRAIGRLVRERREHLGLTQLELAARAGTGRRFISELESGKPTLEFGRMLTVLAALGVRLLAEATADG